LIDLLGVIEGWLLDAIEKVVGKAEQLWFVVGVDNPSRNVKNRVVSNEEKDG
jgi:hypothetical protein